MMKSRISPVSAARYANGSRMHLAFGIAVIVDIQSTSLMVAVWLGIHLTRMAYVPVVGINGAGHLACNVMDGLYTKSGTRMITGRITHANAAA
ncbi:MAG: hypothetical protein LC802_04590 [Acidobacteria bacterium]|nr:hypothetical protein [Acidobacteriota bacterium]